MERAAHALAEAALRGDRVAAKRYAIKVADLRRWRRKLATDDALRERYEAVYAHLDAEWLEELRSASRLASEAQKKVLRWCLSELEREDIDAASRYAAAQLAVSVSTQVVELAVTADALCFRASGNGALSR